MTKIEIKNRWTRAVIYLCDVPDEVTSRMDLRHALEKAVVSGANLRDAELSGTNLSGSDLRGAELIGANLRDSNLRNSDLRGANLRGAELRDSDLRDSDLRGANLRGAELSGSDLRGAELSDAELIGANLRDSDLRGANLREQKNDFWNILLHAPAEIQGLRLALTEGQVDGSTYEGACACLVGTIANVRHANYKEIGIEPDISRPAECWFMGIKEGDTPETNQISRITVEWLDEFVTLLDAARVNTYSQDAKTK